MRYLAVSVSLLLCCSLAGAQSLTELAKKEKERRKANAEAGKEVALEAEGGGDEPITREEAEEELRKEHYEDLGQEVKALDAEIKELEKLSKKASYECRVDVYNNRGEADREELPSCNKATKLRREYWDKRRLLNDLRKDLYAPRSNKKKKKN